MSGLLPESVNGGYDSDSGDFNSLSGGSGIHSMDNPDILNASRFDGECTVLVEDITSHAPVNGQGAEPDWCTSPFIDAYIY
jgi:hypothetical protein